MPERDEAKEWLPNPMDAATIAKNVRDVMADLPDGVTLVAAAKTRSADDVRAAVAAGVTHIGHNYVQEAERMRAALDDDAGLVRWHLIGHLQRNKAKYAVRLFDMVETVDSWRLARALDDRLVDSDTVLPILVEINSAAESNKKGVLPDDVVDLTKRIATLEHVQLQGLMTMGPATVDPEDARPYFGATRSLFDRLADLDLPMTAMQHLSMGMSSSYRVAIEEGATIVRLGTVLFGPRGDKP